MSPATASCCCAKAFYTQLDEDRNTSYYNGATPGAKFSSLAAGVRHNF